MRLFFLLKAVVFVLYIAACSGVDTPLETEAVEVAPSQASFKIDFASTSILELDAETSIDHPIRGITSEGEYYLYNSKNKKIYLYELGIGKINSIKKTIPVPLDAANNFRDVSELYFHNQDSIFIYDRSNEMSDREDLFLLNGKGEIVDKYSLFNSTQGDPIHLNRVYTYNGQTMYFHQGNIFMALSFSINTKEDVKKPLLVFDLKSGKKQFFGKYPSLPEYEAYGQYTFSFSFALDYMNNYLFFSWPYEETLYSFNITELSWQPIKITTNTFSPPAKAGIQEDIKPFIVDNEWFIGLYFDPSSSSLYRLKRMKGQGKRDSGIKARLDIEGLTLTASDQKMSSYRVNPYSLKVELIPSLNMYRIYLFHPTLGPMINAQTNPAFPDMDVEDYLILSPVQVFNTSI